MLTADALNRTGLDYFCLRAFAVVATEKLPL